jgi:hypothetical protein
LKVRTTRIARHLWFKCGRNCVARVEHDEPDRRTRSAQRQRECLGRHQLAAPVAAIEHHAVRLVSGTRQVDDIAALLPIRDAALKEMR